MPTHTPTPTPSHGTAFHPLLSAELAKGLLCPGYGAHPFLHSWTFLHKGILNVGLRRHIRQESQSLFGKEKFCTCSLIHRKVRGKRTSDVLSCLDLAQLGDSSLERRGASHWEGSSSDISKARAFIEIDGKI